MDAMINTRYVVTGLLIIIVIVITIMLYFLLKYEGMIRELKRQQYLQHEKVSEIDTYTTTILSMVSEIRKTINSNQPVDKYINECQNFTSITIAGIPIVVAILMFKENICKDKKIKFSMNAQLINENLLSDDEYVGLLGNLLDNAIEAAIQTTTPWVSFSSIEAQGMWILRVGNSKPTELKPLENKMNTTKEDSTIHGLGTKIIDRIVNQKSGTIDRKDNEDSFEVFIAIPINS
ncbi:MAG: GHKL domain-containing protein [Anaerovoracaceae bacterium]